MLLPAERVQTVSQHDAALGVDLRETDRTVELFDVLEQLAVLCRHQGVVRRPSRSATTSLDISGTADDG